MSKRAEIWERGQVDFQAANDRGRALREEVLRQQRDVLSTHDPAAGTALDVFEAALSDATTQDERKQREAQEVLFGSEAEAANVQFDAESKAMEERDAASEDAGVVRNQTIEDAERIFDEEFRNVANQVFGAVKDQTIASSRAKRDAALKTAERTFARAVDSAERKLQREMTKAREDGIRAFDIAHATHGLSIERARKEHEMNCRSAESALDVALAADPTAVAIREAFQLRLAEVDRDTELEKADIAARMRRELLQTA